MAFTAPVLVPVVTAAQRPPRAAPKRTSLPSMLPVAWSMPAAKSGLPPASPFIATSEPTTRTAAMAPKIVQPWRWSPAIRPNVLVSPKGMTRMANISSQFVSGVGFSNGCAEFALSGPPPFVPSSLIHSCEAIGPEAMCCSAPCRVMATAGASKFWGTPCQTSTRAPTMEIGSRM